MATESATIVQRLWNYCHVLRDDGVSYGDYVEQLTYLLFLKMAFAVKLVPQAPSDEPVSPTTKATDRMAPPVAEDGAAVAIERFVLSRGRR